MKCLWRLGETTALSGGAPAREAGTSGRREAHRAYSREAVGILGAHPQEDVNWRRSPYVTAVPAEPPECAPTSATRPATSRP